MKVFNHFTGIVLLAVSPVFSALFQIVNRVVAISYSVNRKFNFLSMQRNALRLFLLMCCMISTIGVIAQSTSWIGNTSNNWRTASNWTNGVPDASKDVFIGDANYGGSNQPSLSFWFGSGQCKSLTIGGANAITLTLVDDLKVYGSININGNGTLAQSYGTITLDGNWSNSGAYSFGGFGGGKVYLSGSAQTIGGSSVTTFDRLYINSGSYATLARNIVIANFLDLDGTLDPTQNFIVSAGSNDININDGGVLKVMASAFTGNYTAGSADPTANSSVIEYASAAINQTINSSISYKVLKISGGLTKSLEANTSVTRDLEIVGGTLDLLTFTINRSTSGGSLTMANGTTLKIGGTNTFPGNYSSVLLATGSTVNYYGGNQTVSARSYGNLILSSSGGTITKTMPGTGFTVAGNFSSTASAGSLSYTAQSNISVAGNINIGANTSFAGSSFSHLLGGNWTNNGSFSNGCGGTIGTLTSSGSSSVWSGSGSNNFGNLVITGNGTTLSAATSVTLCGNFSTSGAGSFTHTTGGAGTFTMTGSGKSISGSSITLDDLIITSSPAASITTLSSWVIAGNLTVNGTFTASANSSISLLGSGKTISGSGALQFYSLNIPGSITTARNLSIRSNLSVGGSFTASAGQVNFNGASTLSGTANLFNVNIAATSSLTMGGSSVLGIAGLVTSSGTFNATSIVPNTVNYNGSGAQSLVFTNFFHLIVSNGNTKTATAAISIDGNFTIGTSTTFAASTFTHTLKGNWINNGTLSASSSTFQFTGNSDASITGTTNFNNLTINKGAANVITLNNNTSALNVAMIQGKILTGSNSITITSTRTGNGIILGTITRTHAYATGIDYSFEGTDNYINFSSITGTITSITVVVKAAPVTSFPSAASVNRSYTISMVGGATYTALLRLHYEQPEVNGNGESAMTLWNDGGTGSWADYSKSGNDVTANYVEKSGVTDLLNTWTLSEGLIKYSWNGSTSTSWGTPANWTPNGIPQVTDIAHLGDLAFTNQPIISPAAQVKKLYFHDVTPTTLTLSGGGSLTVQGNIDGVWTTDAVHNINLSTGSLTTFSDIVLSDGTPNRVINITASTGIINVNGSLTQNGDANITFTGTGSLNIGENYNYISGVFTPGTGTVTYNGVDDQLVAGLTYYNLQIDKTNGSANIISPTTVTNNFTVATGGQIDVNATLSVSKDITIGASTILNVPSSNTINIGGNWLRSGTFNSGAGTVLFNGTGAQSVNGTLFNNLVVNKPSGTLTLVDDLNVDGNIDIQNGTVDAVTFNVHRTVQGGSASMGPGTIVRFSGASLQIFDFASVTMDATSTIEFYGNAPTFIPPTTYGNLTISNGGSNAKSMVGPTTVMGTLTINAGATLISPTTTLNLYGNLINNGSFDAASGAIILAGAGKTITGGFTANELIVSGSYELLSGNLTIDQNVEVTSTGDFDAGSSTITINGDVTNSGVYKTNGITNLSGNKVQYVQLNNAIISSATGVLNFNGTIEPIFNSTFAPTLATVNINNTAGITPSQPWTVLVAMNIIGGSSFNAGPFTHIFSGNFSNSGTLNSSGSILFTPSSPANVTLGNNFNTSGNVVFGGTGVINLVDNTPTFQSVEVTNTNAGGLTPASNWTVSNNIVIGPGAELKGGSGLTHTISGGWTNNGMFTGQTSIVIFDGNSAPNELKGIGVNNFNSVTFESGSDYTLSSDIAVAQNFTNNAATLNLDNGEVKFNGLGLSVLGGATQSNFADLVIEKTSNSVRMDINASVASSITLTSGSLDLNAHTLFITNPLSTTVIRTTGYILSENTSNNSRINWTINNNLVAHEFPFGNSAGVYIPFTFDLSSGDAGVVSVATYGTGIDNLPLPPGVTELNDALGVNNSLNTVDRFYQIDLLGATTPTADITFVTSMAEVGTIIDLRAQRWNGEWEAPILGQVSGLNTVTVSGVTQFSPWAISGNSSPLPITLIGFSAKQVRKAVELNWSTASEIDNDYFEIEKSIDGTEFFAIGKVNGAINSTEIRTYTFSDTEINKGMFFYRLKQVDLDKQFTYSPIVSVRVGEVVTSNISFSVYPNPTTETLFITHEGLAEGRIMISLLDGSGRLISRSERWVEKNDGPLELDVRDMKPGYYVIQAIADGKSTSFRILKSE